MHEMNIAEVDLNLLYVLDVLLQERSVSKAAVRLRRTQPAVSHALARLREVFQDTLLVRKGGSMQLSPRAERLAQELPRVLTSMKHLFEVEQSFDVQQTQRTFRLAGPDFVAGLLPGLIQKMGKSAPGASVEFLTVSSGFLHDVAEARVDVALAPPLKHAPEGLASMKLASLPWVVYARQGHPALKNWNAQQWAHYPHVLVRTPSGTESPVDRLAKEKKLKRRIGLVLPHFHLAAPVLSKTDLLMTVPAAVLAGLASPFQLVSVPLPMRLAPMEMSLHYPLQAQNEPGSLWFRGQVQTAFSERFSKGK